MAALPPPPDNRIMERNDRKKILNRKKNLFNKAYELSVLCGIDVAVILFQPTNKRTTQPAAAAETWPKNLKEVQRIIRRYKAKLPSTHASSPSTSPPAMKSTTSTPSSSSSSSPSLSPLPSPSRSVLEKRKYIDLDLSLSSCSDSRAKMLKDDKGKRKLLTQDDDDDDDDNINWQDVGMEKQFKSPTTWDHAGGDELYHGEACDDHQAKLASLEAKHKAITERIASLEATRTFFY